MNGLLPINTFNILFWPIRGLFGVLGKITSLHFEWQRAKLYFTGRRRRRKAVGGPFKRGKTTETETYGVFQSGTKNSELKCAVPQISQPIIIGSKTLFRTLTLPGIIDSPQTY